nr:coenzyme F420-0:L-glutamate ligase [Candidatus Njordarchaeum guaymaensis]
MASKWMKLFPVRTRTISERDDLIEVLIESLRKADMVLEEEDVIVVASKVVSLVEGRVRKSPEVEVSKKANELGKKYSVTSVLMQLILDESDFVVGGSSGFVLAVRNGFPCVNACIDAANAPEDSFILPPIDADESAHNMKKDIKAKTGKRVAVIVADSGLLPGRRGTIGVALGFAGLKPSKNYVGKKDIYGRQLRVTFQSVVDDIASGAKLLMGEADERIPFVIVRGAPFELTDEKIGIENTLLPFDVCVFMSNIVSKRIMHQALHRN